jgi:DNA/RNA-binding domain of Phe-tRNA-synthetase-like protein
MTPVTLIHDDVVTGLFPDHSTAAIRLAASNLHDTAREVLAGGDLRPSGNDARTIAVIDAWQQVYRSMGSKPKYTSSLEALHLRFREHGELWKILPLVDLYNEFSLARGLPMAGYDVRGLAGDVRLVKSDKSVRDLSFTPLGEPKVAQHLRSGEVAYVDPEKVVCRYWNWRDCDQTKLARDTADAVVVFDLIDDPDVDTRSLFDDIVSTFTRWFGEAVVGAGWSRDASGRIELGP